MSWQKLSESTFAEFWNLVKNLQQPREGEVKKKAAAVRVCYDNLNCPLQIGTSDWQQIGALMHLVPKELWLRVSTYMVVPSRTGARVCFAFAQPGTFPGLRWLPEWLLTNAFKGLLATVAWGKEQQLGQMTD